MRRRNRHANDVHDAGWHRSRYGRSVHQNARAPLASFVRTYGRTIVLVLACTGAFLVACVPVPRESTTSQGRPGDPPFVGGGTWVFPAGTFALSTSVTVAGDLIVRGAGADQTTITFEGTDATQASRPTLTVVGGTVTIEDVTFERPAGSAAGLLVLRDATATLQGVNLVGAASHGGAADEEARGQGSSAAVVAVSGGTVTLDGVTVRTASGDGIDVRDATLVARGTVVEDVAGVGVRVGGAGRASLEANVVRRAGTSGIWIADDVHAALRANTVLDGREAGFVFGSTASVTSLDDVARGNGLSGFVVLAGAPELFEAIASGNGQSGFVFFGRSSGRLDGATAEDNGLDGVAIEGTASPTVVRLTTRGNGGFGIYVGPDARPVVAGDDG